MIDINTLLTSHLNRVTAPVGLTIKKVFLESNALALDIKSNLIDVFDMIIMRGFLDKNGITN